jgi:hypothetical protein
MREPSTRAYGEIDYGLAETRDARCEGTRSRTKPLAGENFHHGPRVCRFKTDLGRLDA